MKVAFINKEDIQGKDGRKWVKFSGFTKEGSICEIFTDAETGKKHEENIRLNDMSKVFENCDLTDVSFNQRGRFEDAEPVN